MMLRDESPPPWARFAAHFVMRHRYVVLATFGVIAAASAVVVGLRLEVDTDLTALLPADAPSVVAIDQANRRFGAVSPQWIVLRGNEAWRTDCASHLVAALPNIEGVASAHARVAMPTKNPLVIDLVEPPADWVQTEDALLMVLRLAREPTDVAAGRRLERRVRTTFEQGCRQGGALELIGSLASRDHEVTIIEEDMNVATIVALVGIALLMGFRFRRVRVLAIIFVPLGCGIVTALAIVALTFGQLNLLTAFVVALLLGLGIDAAIHLVDRFGELRRHHPIDRALALTINSTVAATTLAAVTTSGVFFVLATSRFKAFSELGWVGGIAMLTTTGVVIVMTLAFLASDVVVVPGKWPAFSPPRRPQARAITMTTAVVLLVGGIGAWLVEFDRDFSRFVIPAPAEARVKDVLQATIHRDEIPAVTVVLTEPELRGALRDALRVKATIASAITIDDVDVEARGIFAEVGPEARHRDGRGTILVAPDIDDLDGAQLERFASEIKEALAEVGAEDAVVASTAYVLLDLQRGLRDETVRLLPLALLVVFVIVGLWSRSVLVTLLSGAPVVVGLLGLSAVLHLTATKIDMFNLAALLLIIGLGVDDGVHLSTRWAASAKRRTDIRIVWQTTSASVLLTSITTAIGFASLILTRHPGLRSLGMTSVVGIVLTTFAALVVLPAVLTLTLSKESA